MGRSRRMRQDCGTMSVTCFVGAASAASFSPWLLPPAKAGGGWEGCPRFALILKLPLPNPPLPSQGRELEARG